ncbi:ubiquitin-like protein 5 [Vombatus ursinus]|uniref:ubiquitin-like protein 5 n=1 Tax=Vombatus ursinus TaxID=29139 RepID=UPI000FFCE69A|nr:ubiquitin-like protein 5 [Vombatus ursinus]
MRTEAGAAAAAGGPGRLGAVIEVVRSNRLGKRVRVKCNAHDSIGDLKKMKRELPEEVVHVFKDHMTLGDYEIQEGMNLELCYQ